jgi:hypothetical protein
VSAYNPVSTTSTTPSQVPQMSLTVNLASAASVAITYSAEMYLSAAPTSGGNGAVISIQVDGTSLQPFVSYTASPYYGADAFTWTTNLASGSHTIAAYWGLCGTGCSGLTAYVGGRDLVAQW